MLKLVCVEMFTERGTKSNCLQEGSKLSCKVLVALRGEIITQWMWLRDAFCIFIEWTAGLTAERCFNIRAFATSVD